MQVQVKEQAIILEHLEATATEIFEELDNKTNRKHLLTLAMPFSFAHLLLLREHLQRGRWVQSALACPCKSSSVTEGAACMHALPSAVCLLVHSLAQGGELALTLKNLEESFCSLS